MQKEHFIKYFLKEIQAGNAAVFAGAGLSIGAGFVDWRGLLAPLAQEINLDIKYEQDLVSVAQYFCNTYNRNRITQTLIDELGISSEPTRNHEILAALPINTYWTTNYDRLIEEALKKEKKICDSKYKNKDLTHTKKNRDVILYKMHGDIENPGETILTKDEYEKYPHTHKPFITALSGDLVSKTFLFLGLSFTDPNLDYILSRIRINFSEEQRNHYCIFKRCSRNNFSSEDEFNNATIRQKLVAKDLERFHIYVIFVDEYSEIEELLEEIYYQYRRKTVFISGSADEFGDWRKEDVEDALIKLGSAMIDKGYRIASGIGLGIGNALVSGAIARVYKSQQSHLDDHILMRPFPQHIGNEGEKKRIWKRYREEIISRTGIAIFLMGNKFVDGNLIIADGVIEEFNIAVEQGVLVLPIGCSGYAAKYLWDKVIIEQNKYYPQAPEKFIEQLKNLGRDAPHPREIISIIIDALELLIKE
ncbi:SIR2 family protein [Arsenophonus apicola]|uniref:NAD(+) hydrolase ThsA n=1 Tax=Arsenophonus apicola TaxID=2879119 RepID=A0ABY8P5C1_9GAMM|nr:SIR2 family protein [Arsenophonus apicola]WGO84691.1 SIR2 family protein [Arsenophonus apicola]